MTIEIPAFREWCKANNLPLPDLSESGAGKRAMNQPAGNYPPAYMFPTAMGNNTTQNRSPWFKQNREAAIGKGGKGKGKGKVRGAKMQGNPPVDDSKMRSGIEGNPPKGSPKKPTAPGMP